ncbi:hypothetical protein [Vibrio phage VH7D]|uniref:Uncharacterized protein n=1 Tax=Vibrio phage VH7D TaxID=1262539 RepID=V9LZ22_9CAUD|nr:hypothetical protein CF80_gp310 [Vibrio phage VH7D]AGB07097.1 hypothetical protein [Vibrio phage VH7D]QNJ55009.1 hypothetical protein vBValMR11Z_83 [Vibrio phage vB_ValM_R11Z]
MKQLEKAYNEANIQFNQYGVCSVFQLGSLIEELEESVPSNVVVKEARNELNSFGALSDTRTKQLLEIAQSIVTRYKK